MVEQVRSRSPEGGSRIRERGRNVTVCSLVLALTVSTARSEERRALLVGIDQYAPPAVPPASTDTPVSRAWVDLDGAANDVRAMRDNLVARYGFRPEDVLTLIDRSATRDAILHAFREHLVDRSNPGDVALFYFAGHGSRVQNTQSPETDRLDETLVPADANEGARDIRDKEIARLANDALDRGARLVLVFDSCHSGSIGRGIARPPKARFMEPDPRDQPAFTEPDPRAPPEERGAMIMSAAQDHQVALEARDENGHAHGAFSLELLRLLRSASTRLPSGEFFQRLKARLQAGGQFQEPVMAASPERLREPLFCSSPDVDTTTRGRMTVAVSAVDSDGLVMLQGGYALGLRAGTMLRAHPRSGDSTTRLRVVEVEGLSRSRATIIVGEAASVSSGDLYEVESWVMGDGERVRAWLPPPMAPEDRRAAVEAIEQWRSESQQPLQDPIDARRRITCCEASMTGSSAYRRMGPRRRGTRSPARSCGRSARVRRCSSAFHPRRVFERPSSRSRPDRSGTWRRWTTPSTR